MYAPHPESRLGGIPETMKLPGQRLSYLRETPGNIDDGEEMNVPHPSKPLIMQFLRDDVVPLESLPLPESVYQNLRWIGCQ